MTLRFWLQHKLPDALVESAFDDHVGARAKGGANALTVDRWPFSKRRGSAEINLGIRHMGIEALGMAQGNTRLFALQFADQFCGCELGF
jgi:hypothetical protein